MNYEMLNQIHELLDSYVVMSILTEEKYEKLIVKDYPLSPEEYNFTVFAADKGNTYEDYELFTILVEKDTIKLLFNERYLSWQDVDEHLHIKLFKKSIDKYGRPGTRIVQFHLKDVEELKKLIEGLEKYGYVLRRTFYTI